MLERRLIPVEQVREFPLFHGLQDNLADEVSNNGRLIAAEPGDMIFRQGDPILRSYFSLSGQLKLFRTTHSGAEKIFHIAGSGESLSDAVSFMPERQYSLNCAATLRSEILSIDMELMTDIFHRDRMARNNLVRCLSRRVEELIDHVELLSVDKASYRVASYLLAEYRKNDCRPRFQLASSKKHIASYLSLQPETLSRCLRSLRQARVARTQAREVEILDLTALERLTGGQELAA